MYYLNSRYYDSKIARFLSEDTYTGDTEDPLSLNLYTYCSNNPITYIDPTGHWQQSDTSLNSTDQAKIIALTNAYYAASASERKSISEQADAIRKAAASAVQSNSSSYYNAASPIKVEVGSQVTSIVNKAVDTRGYMTASEWSQVCSSLGVTNTVDKQVTYSSSGVTKDTNVVTSFGRTDIGVNTNVKVAQGTTTISSSLSMSYNLYSNSEVLFTSQLVKGNGRSIEEAICLMDILEGNSGKINDAQVKSVVGNNFVKSGFLSDGTSGALEAMYNTAMHGKTVSEMDWNALQQRLEEAYNFFTMYYGFQGGSLNASQTLISEAESFYTKSNLNNLKISSERTSSSSSGSKIKINLQLFAEKPPVNPGSLQQQVEKGQAPREVDRVDKPHVPGQKPHVHFKDGTSLNNDGTLHDVHKGTPAPSNKTIDWLNNNGWKVMK